MKSTRLPGKVLAKLGQESLLSCQMIRLENLNVDEFWVATTDDSSDDPIEWLARDRGWKFLRGHKDDVLSRFLEIIQSAQLDLVVRCTGDNPMTDPSIISEMLKEARMDRQVFSLRDESHDKLPIGLVPEVFRSAFLMSLVAGVSLPGYHKANVTSIILESGGWQTPALLADLPRIQGDGWRFTVDYKEDYEFLLAFADALGPDWISADYKRVLSAMKRHPNLRLINSSLRQKNYKEG